MTTDLAPLPGNLPASPLPFGTDLHASGGKAINPLLRMFSAFRRFKWLILLTTIAGAGLGYFATRFMKEKYVVQGSILLEIRGGNAGPVEAPELFVGAQWVELLKHPVVLDPVVHQLKLYVHGPNPGPGTPPREGPTGPDAGLFANFDTRTRQYLPGTYEISFSDDGATWELRSIGKGRAASRGVVGDSAGREYGMLWVPRPRTRQYGGSYEFTLLTEREVSEQVRDALNHNMAARAARFVHVSYDGTDAASARNTLNAILRQFVTQAGVWKRSSLVEASQALDSQLIAASDRVRDAEFALQNFRSSTVTAPRDELQPIPGGLQMTGNYTYTAYLQQRAAIDELKRQRRDLELVLSRLQAGEVANDQMMSIGVVKSSPNLAQVVGQLSDAESNLRTLLITLNDSMPAVKNARYQINEIRTKTLPMYAAAVLRGIDEDLAERERQLQSTASEMRDMPSRTITEQRLARELQLAQTTHSDIDRRAELARLQEASSLADVQILSEAVAPLNPSKNRKSVLMVLGVLAGLGIGLGLAFVLDLLDKRFRYADQVTSGLGLSILGVIPEIKRAKGGASTQEEAAQVVESFRTVRLNLAHIFPENGSIALTVTSPMPGDGKSLISSNLALSFAEAGYRTLLIDGDTRRGELHRTFNTDRRPGLLDNLVGGMNIEDIIRSTSHPKLTLMPAGSRHRNAPELMGSRKMHELIATLRQTYEVIIVDSPPLAAGIDPFVLGTVTGNLLMVVRAGATQRDLAESKLQILDRLPIRLVGAVLNDVRTSMQEYQYYAYSAGYGVPETEEPMAQLPAKIGTKSS